MNAGWSVLCAAVAASTFGCGGSGAPDAPYAETAVTAVTLGEQTVLAPADYLGQPRYAAADLASGEQQATLCRACHSLEEDGGNRIGPNLYGIVGRKAGTRPGFTYSSALSEADFVWTPRALDAWLADPARFLPGNLMAIPGIADAQNRDNLIAYLLRTEIPGPD